MKPAYKCKFSVYFNSLLRYPKHLYKRNQNFEIALFYIAMLLIGFFALAGTDNINPVAPVFVIFGVVAFYFAIILGFAERQSPNLTGILPLKHKKKLLYRFVSPLILTLIGLAALIAVAIVVGGIMFLILTIAGVTETPPPDEETVELVMATGVYSSVYCIAYFVSEYFAGMLVGFIRKRSTRNIVCACYLAAILIDVVLSNYFGGCAPTLETCYAAMKYPQIAITVWCAFAAATVVAAVVVGIRAAKPSEV